MRARGRALPTALVIIAVAGLAGFSGWRLGQRGAAPSERRVAFYQSPMHPWIKSEQPGTCTICGMNLVPVYVGESGFEAGNESLVALSPQTAAVLNVGTSKAVRQPLGKTIRMAGIFEDDDSRHQRLSAYVDGRIDRLFVNYIGAEVEEGEPLVSIYSRDLLVARSEYTLATRMNPGPDRESAVGASREKLRRMGLTLDQIEKLPEDRGDHVDLVAPMGGTVITRSVYEGQYVKEGDVLFEIADFSKMWFVGSVYERDLAWIRVGQPVEIITPSRPGRVYRAPIDFIDPNIDARTRTARVRVVLENPLVGEKERELLHRTYAEGRVAVASEPVLVVPRSAVLMPGSDAVVYLDRGEGHYEARRVLLGRAGDEVWEVVAGLEEGDIVVTTGNLLIDAQAQIARGGVEMPLSSPKAWTEAEKAALPQFFEAVAVAGEALAADDLTRYNAAVPAMITAAEPLAARLGKLPMPSPGEDLKAVRTGYYPLSMAAANLAIESRKTAPGEIKALVFECPMARSAVPTAETNTGRWIQRTGPIRNPFFGAEMLECGGEVLP